MNNPNAIYNAWTLSKLDKITKQISRFDSFNALVNAEGGYFPTIVCDTDEREILADSYDEFQASRNDARRAFRR